MQHRNRRFFILAMLVICAIAFILLAFYERRSPEAPVTDPTAPVTETGGGLPVMHPLTPEPDDPSPSGPDEEMFIIRAYQGRIAVFRYGETTPGQILDTYISALRRADQLLLEQGVVLYGREALAHFLEDFTS